MLEAEGKGGSMEKAKILLVDDHALFLEGMRSFLTCSGFQVVATARNGSEAVLKYAMNQPDFVLMDIQLGTEDGIEVTRWLKREYPEAVIVMLTFYEREDVIFEALQAGASGYLTKGMEPDELINQLERLMQGERPMASSLAERMLRLFSYREDGQDSFLQVLSERQIDILTMLSLGYKYRDIAGRLQIKEATVKYHIREIIDKLHLSSRNQLLDYVSQRGTV